MKPYICKQCGAPMKNPYWDVKDNICNIPKLTKPPTTYSWFRFFKKIIEKIGGKKK